MWKVRQPSKEVNDGTPPTDDPGDARRVVNDGMHPGDNRVQCKSRKESRALDFKLALRITTIE